MLLADRERPRPCVHSPFPILHSPQNQYHCVHHLPRFNQFTQVTRSAFLTRLLSNRGMGQIVRHDSHWVTSYLTTMFGPNRGLCTYMRYASSRVDTVFHLSPCVMFLNKPPGANESCCSIKIYRYWKNDLSALFWRHWNSSTSVFVLENLPFWPGYLFWGIYQSYRILDGHYPRVLKKNQILPQKLYDGTFKCKLLRKMQFSQVMLGSLIWSWVHRFFFLMSPHDL